MVMSSSGEGVRVQAPTLRTLVVMLDFLETQPLNVPVRGINIGPVHRKDVVKASAMLEKKREYACIFAFGVGATPEAYQLAAKIGVQIFTGNIEYKLFNQFKSYMLLLEEERKIEAASSACVLRILPNCVFNARDPIVLGVHVVQGMALIGAPLCVPEREYVHIGWISSIQDNHTDVPYAGKGQNVAIMVIGRSNAHLL